MNQPKRAWIPILLLALSAVFLWRVTIAGQAFVPAGMLKYIAPWSTASEARPVWNPLMYDSVGQFYPWRKFAGDSIKSGMLPLWNPYQFAGTPFVANSQSAVFYPGNILFYLLPTATAAGWTVLLHLTLASWFMSLFLGRLGLGRPAQLFGGIAFAFSTWQVSWLHLPTFLCTSCWIPLCLLFVYDLTRKPCFKTVAKLGLTIGMMLLGGHLQIAFYGLLAVLVWAAWRLVPSRANSDAVLNRGSSLGLIVAALVLGSLLSAPQVIPSLELSRQSHRVSPPTPEGFAAYSGYAVGVQSLSTMFFPDLFGNPSSPDHPYFGQSRGGSLFNYAEGAFYTGIITILLAAFGLSELRRNRLFGGFAIFAILALLMALGTSLDALLYFYVPGFGQSGSPGRSLVLWALSMSALSALGVETLLTKGSPALKPIFLSVVGVLATVVLLALVTASALQPEFKSMIDWNFQIMRFAPIALLGVGALFGIRSGKINTRFAPAVLLLIAIIDLFSVGINYNRTADNSEIYPEVEAIKSLKSHAGHDRIMPVNPKGFSFAGPNVVLPPNGAMVFELHDLQGYDSLFPGQFKAYMNTLAAPVATDASPPEVGNMVFAKNSGSPLALQAGVRTVVSLQPTGLPGEENLNGVYLADLPGALGRAYLEGSSRYSVVWKNDTPTRIDIGLQSDVEGNLILADEFYPGWTATVDGKPVKLERANTLFRAVRVTPGDHEVQFRFVPASFLVGLYLALVSFCLIVSIAFNHLLNRKSNAVQTV